MTELEIKINKSIEKHGLKIPCSAEILTPVHIGSGVKLKKDFDFISEERKTYIIPQYLVAEYLSRQENINLVDDFMNPDFIPKSILEKIIEQQTDGIREYFSKCNTRDLNEFERDGDSTPYIPGSSIKGALRTILLKSHWDELVTNKDVDKIEKFFEKVNRRKAEFAADNSLKLIFGHDSNHNIMRLIEPCDIYFNESKLDLAQIKVLNLTSPTGDEHGWKNLSARKTEKFHKDATSIFSEVLPEGSQANFSIKLDTFLINNEKAITELGFEELRDFSISELSKMINRFTRTNISKELDFLNKLKTKKELSDLIENLVSLQKNIPQENSEIEKKEFIIRIAWGTGWKNMTGDFMDATELLEMRKAFGNKMNYDLNNLNKQFPIFPKSRRIIFENNVPSLLTGFIKVKLNHNYSMAKQKKETVIKEEIFKDDISKLSKLGPVKITKRK